jgi:hypothetical protein
MNPTDDSSWCYWKFFNTVRLMIELLSPNLMLAFSAYVVATASPGPSNLAIMSMPMNS